MSKLLFIGEMAEKEKKGCFFIAIAVLSFNILHQIIDIVAPVNELTGDRLHLTLVEQITVNVADIGYTCDHTCTVAVAQTSLYVIFFVKLRIYNGIFHKFTA